jgi:enoyl-CoA hydratase/carnithine racemase
MMPPHFLQANLKARTASTATEGVSRERHSADELGPVEYLGDSPAQKAKPKEINMSDNQNTRIKRLGYRPPLDVAEPDQVVVDEYVSGGRVAIITLNRPHADNAITTELARQLIEILETVAARPSVRVAVITSAGDRAFSVGGDVYERKEMTQEQWLRQRQVFDRLLYTLRQLRRPIIAAIHGMAYGGGCEIAISTDFIIASDDAVFGQPEAMVGLSAGGGSPVFLPRLLPPGKAMQMLMTGEPITAQEAHWLGMVNEVHPRAELMAAVLSIAEKIADNSPTAVQSVKRAVKMGQNEPVEQAIEIMMDEHWRSVVHPDRVEGILAFTEGREPVFPDPQF